MAITKAVLSAHVDYDVTTCDVMLAIPTQAASH